MINRPVYIQKLLRYHQYPEIKVITGVRRSGKSTLLRLFHEKLVLENRNVVLLNFEQATNDHLRTYEAFYTFLKEQLDISPETTFLLDEIQNVEQWQRALASVQAEYTTVQLYITGSNASLLSGELATNIVGRTVQLHVYPLSFKEYLTFTGKNSQDIQTLFSYVTFGGLPSAVRAEEDIDYSRSVLTDILDGILFRDVVSRGNIRQQELFKRVVKFVMDNIGNVLSVNRIVSYLKLEGLKTSFQTIDSFLTLLEEAFVLYKAEQFDIRGKERLKSQAKYYVVDTGLRNNLLGKDYRDNAGNQLENIVFLELKRRGYTVHVGKYDGKEIDFVANKDGAYHYYQVTRQIPEESTRESDNLLYIPDNYEKRMITANPLDPRDIDGIQVVFILDFLLEEDD